MGSDGCFGECSDDVWWRWMMKIDGREVVMWSVLWVNTDESGFQATNFEKWGTSHRDEAYLEHSF
jgi:hypothetical protein